MQTYLDCFPCFLRQSLDALRMVGANEVQQHQVLRAVLRELHVFDRTSSPPEMGYRIHRLIRRETGVADPYREAKQLSTAEALALYPRLSRLVSRAEDPLATAVRLSIAGNIIDLGMSDSYDLEASIERALSEPLAVDELPALRRAVARGKQVLFLADNAGETVFDRVLIETMGCPVKYVVKGGPVLNDATYEDAVAAGLNEVAEIIDNGTAALGTLRHLCSPEFNSHFSSAQLIIAKGQAHYETLSDVDAPIFFLLQAKCPVIARHVDVAPGSLIVGRGGSETSARNTAAGERAARRAG